MSKTIDERVVEMRFDNKDFESNVKQSMSTLDKLKQALKFPSSSSKSSMTAVANSVKDASSNMSGLNSAVNTVRANFSALDVVAVTTLANITNGVVNATKNLVKSFTIDPVISGFREYELQMNSIQTILANTKSKGTTMDDVTKALDQLNEYADLTIYNFAEMTKNIGTFTAAGVDLDTAVGAIKGIANLGAMSSSTSAQVSTAMYQLSQALATGRVSLMDWNSVVNAGMGGEQFQNALKRTAENMGTDVDALIKKYGSFRDSLTKGQWLTADVLNETLNQIGGAYDAAELRAQGYSEANIKAILDLAETATSAATEVKTFTQLMDTLHEAAGSGWAKTWQLIFGDFEEAKVFFSDLHEMLEPIVTGPIDAMNSVIEKAMGGGSENRWSEFESQLKKGGASLDDFQTQLSKVYKASGKGSLNDLIKEYGTLQKAMASGKISSDEVTKALSQLSAEAEKSSKSVNNSGKSLSQWQKIVDDVWRGDYGNSDTGRFEKLAKAGWDYKKVQELVNMTVDGHRLTLEDLTEAQIVSMGYTKEQAQALKEFANEASAAGKPMNELINDLLAPKKSGRELFLEGIENVLNAILGPLKAVAKAFASVFAIDADGLYDMINGFNKFSKAIIMNEGDLKSLESAFRGLFSVVHIVTSLFGNSLVFAIKAANTLLAPFGLDLLEIAGYIGEVVYQFDRWLTVGDGVQKILGLLGDILLWATTPLRKFLDGFSGISIIEKASSAITGFFSGVKSYFAELENLDVGAALDKLIDDTRDFFKNLTWEDVLEGLTEFGEKFVEFFSKMGEDLKEISPDIIEGLLNGLTEGAGALWTKMQELGSAIITAICSILGIHSPSTVMYEIGRNIVQGLINGIQSLIGGVTDAFESLGIDIQEVLSNIDWGAVMVTGFGLGAFGILYKFTDALQMFGTAAKNITAPAAGAGKIMTSVGEAIDTFTGKLTGGTKLQTAAVAIRTIAQSIAILVAAVVSLTLVDQSKLLGAIGTIAALAAIIGILAVALNIWGTGSTPIEAVQLQTLLLSLAASFALMSLAAKTISGVSWEGLGKAGAGLAAFGVVVAGLVYVSKYAGDEIDKVPSLMIKLSAALLIMAAAVKIIGGMEWSELGKAGAALLAFGVIVGALIAVTKFGEGSVKGASKFLTQIGVAFLMLAAVAKIIGGMETGEMIKAGAGLLALTGIIAVLIGLTNFAGKGKIKQVGSLLTSVGAAMLMLAAVAKIISGMTWGEMGRAAVGLLGLVGVVAALVAITNLAPKEQMAKISATLLAMSLSIGILAGIAVLLGYVNPEKLKQGLVAISILGLVVAAMTQATRGASNVKGSFIGIAIAVGVLAASLAVLSMIDPEKLIRPAIALGSLMTILAFVLRSTSALKKVKVGRIIAMTLMLTLLSAALYILAGLPIESVKGSAVALGSLLLTLSASLKLLSGVQGISGKALGAMAVLTLVVAGLAAILGMMSYMGVEASYNNAIALSGMLIIMAGACRILSGIQAVSASALGAMAVLTAVVAGLAVILGVMAALKLEASMNNVIALSTLLMSMSAACAILGMIPTVSPQALAAMGILTAVVAGLAVILGAMAYLDVEPSLGTAAAISTLLIAMSAAVAILGVIGPLATSAIAGAAGLVGVVGVLTAAIVAFGAIKQIPGVDWLVSEGASFLQQIGSAIGGFIGSIAGGFMEGMTSNLPQIAQQLSEFMVQLTPFLTGAKMITPEMGTSIQNLAVALLALTAGNLLNSITSFLTGGGDLADFAEQLKPFGEAMAAFGDAVKDVDPATISASAEAAKALVEVANAVPKEGGLFDGIFGADQDMGEFGEQLVKFGDCLAEYSAAVDGKVNAEAISASAEAAKGLVDIANELPKEGGLAAAIFGEGTDMDEFGTQLVGFGDSLVAYSEKVEGLKAENISNSMPAVNALVEVAKKVAELKTGGWLDTITGGEMDLKTFGEKLASFGSSLNDYNNALTNIEDLGKLTQANNIIGIMIDMAERLADDFPTEGFDNIAKLKNIGTALKSYSSEIAEVDTTVVNESANVINSLLGLVTRVSQFEDGGGIAAFKTAVDQLATVNVQGIVDAFSGLSADMVAAGANLVSWLANGMQQGSSSVIPSATQNITQMILTSISSQQTNFTTSGLQISAAIALGILNGKPLATASITVVLMSASSSIRGYYGSFQSSGLYIVSGLASGISAGRSQVVSAAIRVANAAAQAARNALQIASPSKVFKKIGTFVGEGLKIGIDNYATPVYKTAYSMGSKAIDGMRSAVSAIGNVIDSGMEFNPTISPVLDLNNVRSGAAAISGMFANPGLEMSGFLNTTGRLVDARIQNGSFNDVVKAVDRLGGKISELERPSYSIGDVTYDDGSNIVQFAEELVRSVRVEKRRK